MIGDTERLVAAGVRQMREDRGWSQKHLSQRLTEAGWPLHQTNVSKLEAARRPIRVTDLEALAEVFDVPAVVFLWDMDQAGDDGRRRLEAAAAEVDYAQDQLISAGVNYAMALAERERLVRAVSEAAGDGQ